MNPVIDPRLRLTLREQFRSKIKLNSLYLCLTSNGAAQLSPHAFGGFISGAGFRKLFVTFDQMHADAYKMIDSLG